MKRLLMRILGLGTAICMTVSMMSVCMSVSGAAADVVFDFENNTTGGFEARNDSAELSVEDGVLKIITQAADTGIKLSGDMGIVPGEHKYVHIRMKRAADSVATKWLFQVADTSNWSTAATLNNYEVKNAADVDSEGYFIETVSFEENTFPENANYFRFDPNRGSGYEAGTYYVDYIIISTSPIPPKDTEATEKEQSIIEDFEDSELNITTAAVRQGSSSLVTLNGANVQKWSPKTVGSPANIDGAWTTGFEAQDNKKGKLTYELDILMERGTGEETADRVINISTSPSYDSNTGAKGAKVAIIRADQIWSGTEDWKNKAVVTAGEWVSLKFEFDYSDGKLVYKGWANDSEFTKGAEGGVDISSALESYDPYDGLYITMYTPGNSAYYIDNFKATYKAAQEEPAVVPEMVTGIKIVDVDVESFDYQTLSYEIKVPESEWNTLSAEDIVISNSADFADAEADIQVSEAQDGIKTVTINVASGEFSQTYVVSCHVLPEPSEEHNDWEWEDFEDSTVSAMIGNEPLDNAESELITLKGRKVQRWGFKDNPSNNSARWTLKPSVVLDRPIEFMGKLTYEFEILFPETNPLEKETNLQSQYALPITLDNTSGKQRMTLVYLRPYVAKSGDGSTDLPLSEPFGWHNVKIVFDYSQLEPVYSVWVDGTVLEQNIEYDAENYNPYEKGIEFRAWVPQTFEYYVDNVRVSYIEVQPEAVNKITVSGTDVDGLKDGKYEYSHDVYEDLYESLSTNDVNVTMNKGFENAEVNVALTESEGKKRVLININQYPYSYTYTVNCEAAMRPAELEISKIEISGDNIIFEGTLTDDRGETVSRDFSVIAYEKGKDVFASYKYIGVMKSDIESDINFKGEFTVCETASVPKLYEMNVLFDAYGLDEPVEKTILYTNEAQLEKSVEWLRASDKSVMDYIVTEDDVNGVSAEWNKEIFRRTGVNVDEYESNENSKDDIKKAVDPYKMSLTRENAAAIINGSVIAVRMTDEEISVDKKTELIAEFDEATMAVEVNGAVQGEKIGFADLSDTSRRWVTENLLARNSEFKNYESLCEEIKKSMLLDLVNNAEYSEIYGLITNNTDVLDDSVTELSSEKRKSVIDKAMKEIKRQAYNSDFEDIDYLVEAVKDACADAKKNSGDSNGNGGSSGGGSSGGGGGAVSLGGGSSNAVSGSTAVGNTGSASEAKNEFTDLDGYEWAKEAIEELALSGIVSGVGNGKYEPGREITREEFVKLICMAFNFEGETEIGFVDVNDDDWFKAYISRGVKNGIITGVSEELFGSGRSVTREDMATIIYRAIIAKGKAVDTQGTDFADNERISEYAKEAVSALAGIGIVNGVGDNMFAPERSAVRAEAAVIIHRCIEQFSL